MPRTKIFILMAGFTLSVLLFFFRAVSSFAVNFSECPPSNPDNTANCKEDAGSDFRFVAGACRNIADPSIKSCSGGKEWQCSNTCEFPACPAGQSRVCDGITCQVPLQGPSGQPSCADIGKSVNTCTGACGNCLTAQGWEDNSDGSCRRACLAGQSRSCDGATCKYPLSGPSGQPSCAEQGKSVSNQCTGTCNDTCATGYTNSGRNGSCILFVDRFKEILEDGISKGKGVYDFSSSTDDENVKVDQAATVATTAVSDPLKVDTTDGSATKGKIILSTTGCRVGWVLKYTTTGWACAALSSGPAGGSGTDTGGTTTDTTGTTVASSVTTPGTGVTTNAAGSISLVSCIDGQILKYFAAAGAVPAGWKCAELSAASSQPVFVGLAATGYDSAVTDYVTLNNKCKTGSVTTPSGSTSSNTGAHACFASEIINTYNTGSAIAASGTGIINNGPPGFTVFANDCNGWQVRTQTYENYPAFASLWSFSSKNSSLGQCDNVYGSSFIKVACCK
ncbi:hypothetical protein HZA43_02720 [Candidatus Peregrinibacteria bacterium]|nr:hypothetical protein [Candidatus Peregrinibacteria bacterium]